MDKNFIIVITLSMLIILLFMSPQYQQRFGKQIPPKPEQESIESPAPEPQGIKRTSSPKRIIKTDKQTTVQTDVPIIEHYENIQVNSSAVESEFTLENEDIKITFSTRGGSIKEVVMNKFDGPTEDEPAQLVTEGVNWYDGYIMDGESEIYLTDIIFQKERQTGTKVILRAELTENRTIIREFELNRSGFMLYAATNLSGGWVDPVINYSWHGPVNDTEEKINMLSIWPFSMFMRDTSTAYNKAVFLGQGDRTSNNGGGKEKTSRVYSDEGSQKIDAKKNSVGQDIFLGDLDWYAVRNKYFMTAAIPEEKMRWGASAEYSLIAGRKWYDFTISKRLSDGITALNIYIGPISYDTLKENNESLTEIMELSWKFIRPISIGFLWLFKKLHSFIPNWGLVIIAFSIIIKIVLYPLSHKSFVSMRKMSALQPQINELREKYKNNQQNLHKATMELYRKESVNPFSGCLPMLLQMPVFFALYPVVGRAFELRQAMFIPHWIEDLSRPDPFYILPIAMGISMFLQQRTTMKDPNQKAMLYIMPVMMVILFANFSSGLTLYWFLFNVMSFMQQKFHMPQSTS